MKIKGIDFPEPLLNALRDGRLVVFAGARVSMGPPAGLPNFRKLTERVTEGISESITESEAVDQFLGRLEGYKGKESYQLATKLLHSSNPAIQHLVQCTETCFISSIQLVQTGSSPPTSNACLGRKREQRVCLRPSPRHFSVQTYGWAVAFRALSINPTSPGTRRTAARTWNPHLGLAGSAVTISTIAT